jgi:hypothetical protein
LGEWKDNKYLGKVLHCPQCKRNYVAQLWEGLYKEVKCSCAFCDHKWKINSICRDEVNDEDRPPAYWHYTTSGD